MVRMILGQITGVKCCFFLIAVIIIDRKLMEVIRHKNESLVT